LGNGGGGNPRELKKCEKRGDFPPWGPKRKQKKETGKLPRNCQGEVKSGGNARKGGKGGDIRGMEDYEIPKWGEI